jgi:hypothetical protein
VEGGEKRRGGGGMEIVKEMDGGTEEQKELLS